MDSNVYLSLIWGAVIVVGILTIAGCQQKQPRVIGECKLIMPDGRGIQ